jgi:hypothetical protein
MGKLVPTVLGMVAEMELGFIKDRQRAGIEAARAKGVYKGRPVTFDHAKIVALRKGGWEPRRWLRPWDASGGTSTRPSRRRGLPRRPSSPAAQIDLELTRGLEGPPATILAGHQPRPILSHGWATAR